jgi:hypothetical protein
MTLSPYRRGVSPHGEEHASSKARPSGLVNGAESLDKLSVEKGQRIIHCELCGAESVLIGLPPRLAVESAMEGWLAWSFRCIYCGQYAQYNAWDVLAPIGLLALPEQRLGSGAEEKS